MTLTQFRAGLQQIDNESDNKRRDLLKEYCKDKMQIGEGTKVKYVGDEWTFTGFCEVDYYGNLRYEIESGNKILYPTFYEFEVVK